MTWSQAADILQVLQGVGIVVLLIMAVGGWRAKTEASPGALARRMEDCRSECDRETARIREQMASFARRDTINETLKGMDARLGNIERMLRPRPTAEEE